MLYRQQDDLQVCFDFGYDVNESCKLVININGKETELIMYLLDLSAYQCNDKMTKWLQKNETKVTPKTVELATFRATSPREIYKGKQEVIDKKIIAKIELPISTTKKTLQQKLLFKLCTYCNDSKTCMPLLYCSACKMVAYCNKLCQKSHWKGHRPLFTAHHRGKQYSGPKNVLCFV